jgi:RNA-directed DNA polymerase
MSAVSARSVSRTSGVDRVRALQRVLYRCAKQDRDRRFHALYDKVARGDVMRRAWSEVRANHGAPGVDGVSIDDIERSGVDEFLDGLAARLRAGEYRPRPLRRVRIPKPGRPGQTRPLGIPTVGDRVVMAAARIVLEPIFEADFLPSSYGFRPGLTAHHALEAVRQTATWRGKQWVLDADIRSCFDEIDHDALLEQIGRRVCDRRMLKLLRGWLRAGVFEGGIVSAIEQAPRKARPSRRCWPTSPCTRSMAWQGGGRRHGVLVRYADDLVVLCVTREQAEQARELMAAVLDTLGLRLQPEKTRIVHLARGEQSFVFLGFEQRMRESWKQPGRWYLHRWPSPRAMAQIRAKIRERTRRSIAHMPMEQTVENLNRVLRGWGNYFRYGNSADKFDQIDAYVNQRMAMLASTRYGLRGWNWSTRFDHQWVTSLGVHRFSGTIKRTTAYASR